MIPRKQTMLEATLSHYQSDMFYNLIDRGFQIRGTGDNNAKMLMIKENIYKREVPQSRLILNYELFSKML